MLKYDEKIIKNYINGLDIDGYTFDELEDDYNFMIDVMDYTKDFRMINFCSLNVLHNYEFIKYLINKFGAKNNYLNSIIDDYIENETDNVKLIDIVAKMYNYTKLDKYKMYLDVQYAVYRLDYEQVKDEDVDAEFEFGKGFLLIQDLYGSCEDAMNYFARKCLNEIMLYHEIDLEALAHQSFKTKSELEKYGLNSFILSIINSYDKYLSAYLATHLFLIDDLKNKLKKIIENFSKYDKILNYRRYNRILMLSYEFLDKKETNLVTPTEMIYYIAKEYDIENELFNYEKKLYEVDIYSDVDIEDMIKNINKEEFGISDSASYFIIKKFMGEVLNSSVPEKIKLEELKDEYLIENKDKVKEKIIKFNPII